jgi:hypothetical protein
MNQQDNSRSQHQKSGQNPQQQGQQGQQSKHPSSEVSDAGLNDMGTGGHERSAGQGTTTQGHKGASPERSSANRGRNSPMPEDRSRTGSQGGSSADSDPDRGGSSRDSGSPRDRSGSR